MLIYIQPICDVKLHSSFSEKDVFVRGYLHVRGFDFRVRDKELFAYERSPHAGCVRIGLSDK